ncbi:MAG: molybdopterin dehydrogenase [Ignavibacteria bacterium RBG_13_36_8]|nr:MAG: molybdopterin dehydrogenase [Ignavibacteria bacterium RBG_13_36_8]
MNNFNYVQQKTIKEVGQFIKEKPNSILYAGGTDALDLIKHNVISPENVVNLKLIPDMDRIRTSTEHGLSIGALVNIAEIANNNMIVEKYPILAQAAREVASPQLRNMGTVGGNICQRPRCWYFREDFNCLRKGGGVCYAYDGENKYHCIIGGGPCFIVHPSDLAVALLALEAKVTIQSAKGKHTIPISEFFMLPDVDYTKENILQPGEVVTEILIPALQKNIKSSYVKFKERGVWDFAIVSVGAVIKKEGNKIIEGRIALGGIAPVPWVEKDFNGKLTGLSTNENSISEVVKELLNNAEPLAKNEYKLTLARNLTKQLLLNLVA